VLERNLEPMIDAACHRNSNIRFFSSLFFLFANVHSVFIVCTLSTFYYSVSIHSLYLYLCDCIFILNDKCAHEWKFYQDIFGTGFFFLSSVSYKNNTTKQHSTKYFQSRVGDNLRWLSRKISAKIIRKIRSIFRDYRSLLWREIFY
jgi:hypothetical protein